ncbi:unnamed protein product [Protopolystoma xenopodis]|uniref:Uncharacterized protein n=1 Tax=Protopolystoma xenopodis TaxID=117903 RepID=A0A3S5C1I8_9PLAT|nr:unnamed protein product [Protopolystoma xenopodis]
MPTSLPSASFQCPPPLRICQPCHVALSHTSAAKHFMELLPLPDSSANPKPSFASGSKLNVEVIDPLLEFRSDENTSVAPLVENCTFGILANPQNSS